MKKFIFFLLLLLISNYINIFGDKIFDIDVEDNKIYTHPTVDYIHFFVTQVKVNSCIYYKKEKVYEFYVNYYDYFNEEQKIDFKVYFENDFDKDNNMFENKTFMIKILTLKNILTGEEEIFIKGFETDEKIEFDIKRIYTYYKGKSNDA